MTTQAIPSDVAKRTLDFVVAAIGLVLLIPVLLAIAFAVWLALGTPVLFCQQRPGLFGKPFLLLKFRTMTNCAGAHAVEPANDELRLTRFGAILRASSLDELPQLWNVLKGDMSLVGPRPLLMQYLPRYNDRQAERHLVRPGLTGWAQVRGRNSLSWEARLELDVWYVENRSFWLDLKILGLTILRVLRPWGVTGGGSVTMREFRGSDPKDVD